ncbi:2-dehydropantoate 2-reductase [Bacillus sp. SG-1]|uniref:2-dehydropantoate 2-reductase n=1 Tax=Bacillus sp. SG-1 TaxID=161544 RepID=UPI0001544DCC|nr:2-dehydropantoate 2-reductase [Bacillus sp. SG-1]EDL64749.1 2-dehydropantoate 2-reductase [Bacillus sp. SG-1]
MKVGIIGGGAIGLLFAAYLGKKQDVTLFVKSPEQQDSINSMGIILRHPHTYETVMIKAVTDYENLSTNDLIIIAVKQYHLSALYETLKHIPADTPLLFLQNGIGHLTLLEKLPHLHLYVGTVEHGALRLAKNEVAHKGKGKTNVAIYRGSDQVLERLSQESIDFPVRVQPEYEIMLFEKLAVNAVINPLTAVLGVRNGRLIENEEFKSLAESVFDDITRLYPRFMHVIDFKDIITIAYKTRENTSSMLADLQAKRQTEIEAILGAMVDEAKRQNISLSIIPTLYKMVKGLDKEGRKG